ncbi:hypothetical protein ABIF20_001123 [Bradyrhizobium japonicum]
MHQRAGAIPDSDDQLILVFAFEQRTRTLAVAWTDIDGDLLQLRVEEFVHLIGDQAERRCRRQEADGGQQQRRTRDDRLAKRVHDPDFVTIHPAPRMFRMTSLPYRLRKPWMTTSTALLCTSSLQP